MRLFTQTPYPEFEYIITPKDYAYCANQSLYSFVKGRNFHFNWVDVTPGAVLDFVYVQTCILKFNNPDNLNSNQFLATLDKIFKWGSEDPYEKIARNTIEEIVDAVVWADNYLDVLEDKGYGYMIYEKSIWYSDSIMKPTRIQGEKWKEYTNRIRTLKAEARSKRKNTVARAIIIEKSRELRASDFGLTPTPQKLNTETKYEVRKIKEITEKGVIWQDKSDYSKMKLVKLKALYPKATQEDLAKLMGISSRTLRRIIKELK